MYTRIYVCVTATLGIYIVHTVIWKSKYHCCSYIINIGIAISKLLGMSVLDILDHTDTIYTYPMIPRDEQSQTVVFIPVSESTIGSDELHSEADHSSSTHIIHWRND